jgi:hypothetical protein
MFLRRNSMVNNGILSWDDILEQNTNGDAKDIPILRLASGKNYRIRPVSVPCKILRLFRDIAGQTFSAISDGQSQFHLPDDVRIRNRYVVFVLDREDNKVKILDGTETMFRGFASHAKATGRTPHDPQRGSDYSIKVTGVDRDTRYSVTPVEVTPLTSAEMATVNKLNAAEYLLKMYKPHTPEQIVEKLHLAAITTPETDPDTDDGPFGH